MIHAEDKERKFSAPIIGVTKDRTKTQWDQSNEHGYSLEAVAVNISQRKSA